MWSETHPCVLPGCIGVTFPCTIFMFSIDHFYSKCCALWWRVLPFLNSSRYQVVYWTKVISYMSWTWDCICSGLLMALRREPLNPTSYANNLAIIPQHLSYLQDQITKLERFKDWACMEHSISNRAITGAPHRIKPKPDTFKTKLEHCNLAYKRQTFPTLSQTKPTLIPESNSSMPSTTHPTNHNTTKNSNPPSLPHMVNIKIRPWVWCTLCAAPFAIPSIKNLDQAIVQLVKEICTSTPNTTVHMAWSIFDTNAHSFLPTYTYMLASQLCNALNNSDRLGLI